MFPTRPRIDPAWVRELGLDRDLLVRVREDVHSLQLNDSHPGTVFEKDTPSADARRLRMRLGRRWRTLDIVIPIAMIALGFSLRFIFGRPPGLLGDLVTVAPQLLMAVGVVTGAIVHIRRGALNPYYATVLRKHGIIVCPRCGYRPANDDRTTVCPECGLDDPIPRDGG